MAESKTYSYTPAGDLIIEGPDAASFLQGQFSQDLRIPEGAVAYGLWLDRKGKIVADSFLLKESADRFRAFSYFGPSALIRENLEPKIIMDEVEIRDSPIGMSSVSLWGEAIAIGLDWFRLPEPQPDRFSIGDLATAYWGRRGREPNLEIAIADGESAPPFVSSLRDRGIQILDTNEVACEAMRSGRFEVGNDVLQTDLPQESNLDRDAVSYEKGCYIGQEVMARIRSMGKARRSLEFVAVSEMPAGDGPWPLLGSGGGNAGELRRALQLGGKHWGSAMMKTSMEGESRFSLGQQASIVVDRNPAAAKE